MELTFKFRGVVVRYCTVALGFAVVRIGDLVVVLAGEDEVNPALVWLWSTGKVLVVHALVSPREGKRTVLGETVVVKRVTSDTVSP